MRGVLVKLDEELIVEADARLFYTIEILQLCFFGDTFFLFFNSHELPDRQQVPEICHLLRRLTLTGFHPGCVPGVQEGAKDESS